jgi:GMP synthase (glutamine-hydrolysing)
MTSTRPAPSEPRLIIVQPGQKLPDLAEVDGDFADWMLAGMGWTRADTTVVKPHLDEPLPDPERVRAALVTGSSAMVTDGDPWIEASAEWLRVLVGLGVPVLGICFGHQLLAQALGGLVHDYPNGVEIGTVTSRLTQAATADPLFAGLSSPLQVQASHRQAVIELPDGALRLAASEQDPNHAFRYGGKAWGIQFHPEFDQAITRAYVEYYRADLEASGLSVETRLARVEDLNLPTQLLRRFAGILSEHAG